MAPLGVLALFVYVCMYVCSFVQNQPIVSDFVNYRFRFFFGGGGMNKARGIYTKRKLCVAPPNILCRATEFVSCDTKSGWLDEFMKKWNER
jgi:hypothetical protein